MLSRLVYVSGPISKVAGGNVEAFRAASIDIFSSGAVAVNPHDICDDVPSGSCWTVYMRRCVAALAGCDEIVMLPGWPWSRGARWELVIALMLGLRVSFEKKGLY